MIVEAVRDRIDTRIAKPAAMVSIDMPLPGSVQWFYTPMPAPAMVGAFGERAVVYDCMDELAQFRFAPAGLVDARATAPGRADVVFTGGRSLYEAKSKHHHERPLLRLRRRG